METEVSFSESDVETKDKQTNNNNKEKIMDTSPADVLIRYKRLE